MKIKTCYIYTRTAMYNQAEKINLSLLHQRSRCETYARQKKYKVVGIFEDLGVSGNTYDRKGLQELIASCNNNHVDYVLVSSLDRISRSVAVSVQLLKEFRKTNTQIVVVDNHELAMDNFLRDIYSAIDEYEYELTQGRRVSK